jgi:hypothetical protein
VNLRARYVVMDSVHLLGEKNRHEMKSTFAFLAGLAVAFSTTAQKVEHDDMYFTSKDRTQVKAATAKVQVKRTPATLAVAAEPELAVNPTDTYSARNVNPEYSTINGAKDSKKKADYFIENYAPTGVNSNLKGSSSTTGLSPSNSAYALGYSPYSSNSMSMTYGSMYGYNRYNPWGYNPWVYGGAAYGYGNVWTSPWAMYDPFFDPFYTGLSYYPFGFFGYNGGAYRGFGCPPANYWNTNTAFMYDPTRYDGTSQTYQKRIDRSSSGYRPADAGATPRDGRTSVAGRTSADGSSQTYYERGWRSSMYSNQNTSGQNTSGTRSSWSSFDSGNTGAESPSWGTRSAWGGGTNNGSVISGGGSQSRTSWSSGSESGGSRSSSVGGGSVGGGGGGGGGTSRGRD